MNQNIRLGIDLGGTKIEIIALDSDGATLARKRVPTPRHDYEGSLQLIRELVLGAESELGRQGTVGVAMPGTISPATGLVKNANSTWLNGRTLDKDLEKLLARPVRFRNDADCFALSEATDGAAKGAKTVFGVIVGTGTGAGIVVNGRLLEGPNGIAGEWGHNPLPWPRPDELPGPDCYCGHSGCLETWLSGPGMAADHRRRTGEEREALAIVAAAKSNDAQAATTLQHYEDRMARGLAHVINILDPAVIVLGGGMSNIESLYEHVPRLWQDYVFSDRVDTRLVPPVHGDSSGVRGAAWLW
jgi:fructokinase